MILPSQHIRARCIQDNLISPFHEREVINGMTFGLGPAGYDVRIKQKVTLMRGEFALASTIERFHMPNDLLAKVADKSSWARRGIAIQNTIIEPGWSGWLTLEITNHGHCPVDIAAGSSIAQILFLQLADPTEMSYAGKYQDQANEPVAAIYEK